VADANFCRPQARYVSPESRQPPIRLEGAAPSAPRGEAGDARPALGFCPPIGELFSAALQRQGDTFLLSTSVLDEGTPGVDPCLESFIDFEGSVTCAVRRPQSCRLLSSAETDRVRAVFSAVTLYNGPDAACLDLIADPCVIDVLRWDGLTATDHVHGTRRYDFDQFDQITALLESLRAGPVVPCPASATAQR
jgi:hypothetical protein